MTNSNEPASQVRIGELSRRTGVSDHVLRAWERRYELLRPERTTGGYRLYSSDDEQRVRRMVDLLDRGLSPAEAARTARADAATGAARSAGSTPSELPSQRGLAPDVRERLFAALEQLDDAMAQRAVDELLSGLSVETAVRDVLLPFLRDVGERWRSGEVTVAQEHFASQLLRGRLGGLARGWGAAVGPAALLACLPDERHDIALLAFSVVLRRRGWVVTFLGADTPLESVSASLRSGRYDLVVLAGSEEPRFEAVADQLVALARRTRLLLAGPGATDAVLETVGVRRLEGDPVTAALRLEPT